MPYIIVARNVEGSFLYTVGNVSCSEQVDASGNNVFSLNTTDGAVSKPVGGIMSVPLKKKHRISSRVTSFSFPAANKRIVFSAFCLLSNNVMHLHSHKEDQETCSRRIPALLFIIKNDIK